MSQKKVLFLSDINRYLEHELYCYLGHLLKQKAHTIYFDSEFKDNVRYFTSKEKDSKEKEDAFEHIVALYPPQHNKSKSNGLCYKIIRLFSYYAQLYGWKKIFLKKVVELDPSVIVMVGPNNLNARLIRKYYKEKTLIYLQPGTIRRSTKASSGWKGQWNRFIFNKVLGLPIVTESRSVFEIGKEINFVVWSPLWVEEIENKSQMKFHYLGNPLFDRYFSNFRECKSIGEKAKVLVYLNKEDSGIEDWMTYAEYYQEAIERFTDLSFEFKIHPLGNKELSERTFPNCRIHQTPVNLDSVELVLTHWSTASLESMAIGIPTILINPDGKFDFRERYMDMYGAIATTIKDLELLITRFKQAGDNTFSNTRKEYLELSMGQIDGKSGERIAYMIGSYLR